MMDPSQDESGMCTLHPRGLDTLMCCSMRKVGLDRLCVVGWRPLRDT